VKKATSLFVLCLLLGMMVLSGCDTSYEPIPTAPGQTTAVPEGSTAIPTGTEPGVTATAVPTSSAEIRIVSLSDPNGTLRVRETPSTEADVVTVLANGANVTVLATEGEWIKIKTADNELGYIMTSYTVAQGQQPTAKPTANPTTGPTQKPGAATPAPDASAYGLPDAKAAVSMSFFDDALFVGDSVSYGFKLYVDKQRNKGDDYLGKSIFLTAGSFGIHHAITAVNVEGSVHPSYGGQKWLIENFMADKKLKKVYIMLGMNDVALYGIEASVTNYATLISRIRAKVPDAVIYIQSVTPTTKDGAKPKLNNTNIYAFNDQMNNWANNNQCYFLDIASVLKDDQGNLPTKLSNDNFVHLADAAFPLWVDYLRTHTN